MSELIIGIDPGENNGVATWTKANGLILDTMPFWKLIERLENLWKESRAAAVPVAIKVIIENPNLNSFMYAKRIAGKDFTVAMATAQNVGMNKQDAKRIIQRIKALGFQCEEIRPTPKAQKWNAEYFNRMWSQNHPGPAPRSNEHNRDAARLISRWWI